MEERTILLTGFGPFGEHKINASWESVKLLENTRLQDYIIKTQQIKVSYKYIDENVPLLWEKYKPSFVIHVGVSSLATKITIESKANRSGYAKLDVDDYFHPNGSACQDGPNCIETGIPTSKICEKLDFCESQNAGRYLCEYTYYKSLSIDPKKTLFVHVPPIGSPYSVQELADGIKKIILDVINCENDLEKCEKLQ